MPDAEIRYIRGEILHFLDDPSKTTAAESYEYFSDGLMIVENGKISGLGEAKDLLHKVRGELIHYRDGLIVPGFIDTHVHYPQTEMIASFGEQLLGWLESYAFPTEIKYSDFDYALQQADFFLDQLLRNGTTTALVFGTVHPESVEAFFIKAKALKLRMICGKVLMDRNAPSELLDTAERGFEESKLLIEKWHGVDRLQYAVTPRFAPTSSDEQLRLAGKLLTLAPDLYMHTHLAENKDELLWVKKLFPDNENYLDVYFQHGLLSARSVFAHCIYLSDEERQLMGEAGCSAAFCPTSNLFIGSGLFNLKQTEDFNIKVGLGTDVGGGTSFSMLQTINEAYKVQQLLDEVLPPLKSFYLATLGGARALDLEDKVGSFKLGNEADFIVLDYKATPLIEMRLKNCSDITEKLFVLSMLGDDRCVRATHILGECVYTKSL
jgi:guanine deaminase